MKKLIVLPLILVLFFPGALAVVTNAYFEGDGSLSEVTIAESESTNFTATAFTMDPPVHGEVFMVKDDLTYSYIFEEYNVNNGSYGSYFRIFDVDYGIYNYSCGDFTITVQGYDSTGGSHYIDIYLHVTCNNPPSITPPDAAVDEDSGFNDNLIDLEAYASDVEDDTADLTYAIFSQSNTSIVNCSIDGSNNLDCTTEPDLFGFSDVNISVTDTLGKVGYGVTRVTVNNVNDPPTLDPINDITVQEAETVTITAVGNDIDPGETITYSINDSRFSQSDNVFSWVTGYDDAGVYSVEVSVSDGEASASQTLTVTVNNVNRAPVLDPIGDKTAYENSLLEFNVTAADPDNDALTYSAANLPPGASFDPATQTFSWTPSFNQSATYPGVLFFVTDGALNDSETITITVNDENRPPQITSTPVTSVLENSSYAYDVDAVDPDGDDITYALVSAPEGMTIDSASGLIDWFPTQSDIGDHFVNISATDGYLYDYQDYTLTVNDVNFQPSAQITQPSDGALLTQDVFTTFIAVGTDPDGDNLTYTWDFGDSTTDTGATVLKAYSVMGDFTVSVNVSDGEFSAVDSITVTVLGHQYNITSLKSYNDSQFSQEDSVFYRNEPLYIGFNVIDEINGSLIPNNINDVYMYNNETGLGQVNLSAYYGVVGGVNITSGEPETPNGSYYYYLSNIPLLDEHLGWNIVFVFSYSENSSGQATLPIQILNNEIVLLDIPDVTFNEDESDSSIDLDDYVSDVETPDDEINWSYSGNTNADVNIDAATHVVTFTASQDWNGNETITFTASDTDGSVASDDVLVTVLSVNDAPLVSGIPDINMSEDSVDTSIDLDDYTTDADNSLNELTWSASGNVDIAVDIDAATHVVTLSSGQNWSGQEVITFTATDPGNLSDSDSITVTVLGENDFPEIVSFYPLEFNVSFLVNDSQYFNLSAVDVDGDNLSYYWFLDDSLVSSSQEYTFSASQAGVYDLVAVVSDSELNVSHSWLITVTVFDIIAYGNFSGNTTDFTNLSDPENVYNVTIENEFSGIYFGEQPLNISTLVGDLSVLLEGVVLTNNIVGIDSTLIPDLGGYRAKIRMTDIPEDFIIYYSDTFTSNPNSVSRPCPSDRCFGVNYNAQTGSLTFEVSHFSVYKASSPTPLRNESKPHKPRGNIKIMKAKAASHIVEAGDYVDLLVSLLNIGEVRVNDVVITITIPDLGFKEKFHRFDLGVGKREGVMIPLQIPYDTEPGEYYIRVSAFGNNDRRAKYVPIYVY